MTASLFGRSGAKMTSAQSLFVGLAVFLSAVVLAQNGSRLVIFPGEDQLLTDEIYERADGWREPPMFESEWRAPRKDESSRITFGYDSAYEARQARENAMSINDQSDFHEPRPNTIFRWNFGP
jgi:hypothetical protein